MPRNTISALALTHIASSTVTGSYKPINPNGMEGACFFIRINNASDENITLSYDGVTDNEYVFADTSLEVSSQLNSQPNNKLCLFPKGQIIYVKGTAGTGNIYLSGYYQE